MKFIKKSFLFFISVVSLQTDKIHAAQSKAPDYFDQTVYLPLDINFEDNYPEMAYNSLQFLEQSLQECMTQELTEITEATEKKKRSDEVPFTYKHFTLALPKVEAKIKNAQIAYLIGAVRTDKNSADLTDDSKFQSLKASQSTSAALESSQLPYLESIEKNNDVLVHLVMTHHLNLSEINWNEKLPTLAQGCEILLQINANDIIHKAIEAIDEKQLTEDSYKFTVFQTLHAAVIKIEKNIIKALESKMLNINSAINNAINIKGPIDPIVMPALSYLLENKDVRFLHLKFKKYIDDTISRFGITINNNVTDTCQSFIETKIDLNFNFNNGHYGDYYIDTGYTPLHWATLKSNSPMIMLMLNAGADVNITDKCGNAPLHIAVYARDIQVVQALLNAKADLTIKNYCGKTALGVAQEYANESYLERAMSHGMEFVEDSYAYEEQCNSNRIIINLLTAHQGSK